MCAILMSIRHHVSQQECWNFWPPPHSTISLFLSCSCMGLGNWLLMDPSWFELTHSQSFNSYIQCAASYVESVNPPRTDCCKHQSSAKHFPTLPYAVFFSLIAHLSFHTLP
jgi:hypothetical protein